MTALKQNVEVFNLNVQENGGFLYTTNASFSSIVANKRINDEVYKFIKPTYKTLIDIGCGDGVYTNEIKKQFPNLQVTGFDPASKAVENANKKFPEINFKTINLLDDNIPVPTQKYDVGIIRGVLHHLTDQQKAIENAFRFTDNLIIIEPNGNNPILKIIEKFSKYHIEHEEQSFPEWKIKKWIGNINGQVKEWSYIGYIPYFFPTLPSKIIYFFQPFLEKMPIIRHFFTGQFVIVCSKK